MTRITIVGGTGYTGSAIAREAFSRGLEVTSFSRSVAEGDARIDGVAYETGSLTDPAVRSRAIEGADVLVSTLSPRGKLDGRIVEVDRELAALADAKGARFIVVGGFSSLRPAEGAPRFAEGDDIPPQFAAEAKQMNEVLSELLASPESLDFVFLSPAQQYGAYAPGEATGRYRVGGDVAFFDADGASALSGADFALAIVDEIERPSHRRAHVSVAY
ncbi:NAD(P)-dependent oxidoreductase [Rathayibacter sp. VKM Ac-2754]|uniref:NAD(P)-dependent oxidoreductase n=1 Tax=Rathayibacter sp. VKM Ac-2754 TaxID=2609251 RepID=UPI001358491E|nr:NAD(P)H-binding protein [Rathayibacter sp. VKM Ac-2754]MWV60812.1 NAD(P)H-binding protein [Rathayibacter sp. VKM Ac-2754]